MPDIDIGADLLKKIRKEFAETITKKDNANYIAKILDKVENGTADFNDVSRFSQGIGYRLSEIIKKYVTPENLPDGTLYYNIADTVLQGTLHDNYELINGVASSVQKTLDKKAGISIKPQQANYPADRVHSIVNSLTDATATQEVIQRRLDAPVRNVTNSMYDDYVETNAKFRSKAGLECYIIRDDHNGCCEWCAKLSGKYKYPNDVPKNVYQRHDNCTCSVTYVSGKNAQNVWSKKTWQPSENELTAIKSKKVEVTKLTPQEAKAKEDLLKSRGKTVDKVEKSARW